MATIAFPQIRRLIEGFSLSNPSRGGIVSLSGSQQNVMSGASYWIGKFTLNCERDDDYRALNGFLAGLDGMANNFACGPIDWRGQPWNINPVTGGLITPGVARMNVKKSQDYENNPDTTSRLTFTLAAAAAMNQTAITIRRTKGGRIRVGQYFSIGNRMHIITAVQGVDPVDARGLPAPGDIPVSIRPWLRSDQAAGATIDFATPTTLVTLTRDSVAMLERTSAPLAELPLSVKEYF